ncbi:MAG: hypothetical protein WBC70_09705 [Candidatus Aminicenantales bacterium]
MGKHKPSLGGMLAVLAVLFSSGCGGDSSTTTEPPPTVKEDPSFAADIQSIFNKNCVSSGCHNASASGGLVLLQGQAYANLINVASTQEPGKTRVIPNDAANSYIVIKLEGRQTNGSRMPLGGTLDANSIQNIKNWIDKGAKNN